MSTKRKQVKFAPLHPTQRNIRSSHQLLDRIRLELEVELQKISKHLEQPNPRHSRRFLSAQRRLTTTLETLRWAVRATDTRVDFLMPLSLEKLTP